MVVMRSAKQHLVVLTGASGSGKTTLARHCASLHPGALSVHHFDAIPVPGTDEMVDQFGSVEEWQRIKTFEWVERLSSLTVENILFEGQSRISFFRAALAASAVDNAKIILVDCDDVTRLSRLSGERNQPELANQTMLDWAAFLRAEAKQDGCPILETSKQSIDTSARIILENFHL